MKKILVCLGGGKMKKVLGIVGILDSGSLLAAALEEKRRQGAFAVQSKMKVILALEVLEYGGVAICE